MDTICLIIIIILQALNAGVEFLPYDNRKQELRELIDLIDGDELIELILDHYEKFDSKYKAMLPLKNVYIPTQIEGE